MSSLFILFNPYILIVLSLQEKKKSIKYISTQWLDHGLVLGPVLLNDLVNDLNKGVHTKIPKSVDDTQLFAVVQCSTNGKQLQEDLMWAKKLSIKFKAGAKWCKKNKNKKI